MNEAQAKLVLEGICPYCAGALRTLRGQWSACDGCAELWSRSSAQLTVAWERAMRELEPAVRAVVRATERVLTVRRVRR